MVFRAYVALQEQSAAGQRLVVTALEEIKAHLHPQAGSPGCAHLCCERCPGRCCCVDPLAIRHRSNEPISRGVTHRSPAADWSAIGSRGSSSTRSRSGTPSVGSSDTRVRCYSRASSCLLRARQRSRCLSRSPRDSGSVDARSARGQRRERQRRLELHAVRKDPGAARRRLVHPGGWRRSRRVGRRERRPGNRASAGRGRNPEVVLLPGGLATEAHLVAAGFRGELEAACAKVHGPEAVRAWGEKNHGSPAKGTQPNRDYRSAGWEDRLIVDFLVRYKTGWGAAFAHECLAQGPQRVPTTVQQAVVKIDALLGDMAP